MDKLVLSPRMTAMVLASVPDDITGNEGAGVELRTGADYCVAKALERRGMGTYSHGSPVGDLYFNNAEGLAMRRDLRGEPDPVDIDDDDD